MIHRDLKPSNVLVTEQAGSPQPKVIDFGIAKALGQKLTERTLATEFGAIMGTPAYMSPEQAEGSGLDVDTRTDVYSLGVMLYEALVGKLPVDPAELGFMPFLAQLLARESNPPTPSARVRKMNGDRTSLAALRRVDARRFASELSGDLDWIVMKAIAPERERRYETAQAFAADVRRFLADEPIEARPPSTTYRLKKFVKRNTVGVIASAAAVVALIAGAVAASVGLVRATRAEADALAAQGKAEQEAQTATRVSDFLVGLFKVSDPSEARGNTITARQILDSGVTRIGAELSGEPLVQARLMTTMGQVYSSLGFRVPAESLYRKALVLREAELGPEAPDVAESLARLSGFLEDVRDASDSEVQRLAERALCDEAVAAASEQDRPAILDSRGLAKALAGDTASAIADFEAYLATRDSAAPDAVQRRAWVEALQAGQNPFTEDELNKLRF